MSCQQACQQTCTKTDSRNQSIADLYKSTTEKLIPPNNINCVNGYSKCDVEFNNSLIKLYFTTLGILEGGSCVPNTSLTTKIDNFVTAFTTPEFFTNCDCVAFATYIGTSLSLSLSLSTTDVTILSLSLDTDTSKVYPITDFWDPSFSIPCCVPSCPSCYDVFITGTLTGITGTPPPPTTITFNINGDDIICNITTTTTTGKFIGQGNIPCSESPVITCKLDSGTATLDTLTIKLVSGICNDP